MFCIHNLTSETAATVAKSWWIFGVVSLRSGIGGSRRDETSVRFYLDGLQFGVLTRLDDSKSIWLVKTCSNFPQRFCVGVQPQPGVYTERKYSYTKPDCVMAFKWQSLLWLIAWSSTRLGQRHWLCANGWLDKCSKPQRMGRNVQRPREFKVCSLLYYRYRV